MADKVELVIKYKMDVSALPDPIGANFVGLNRMGDDYMLQLGWLNVAEMVAELGATAGVSREVQFTPRVTHQFLMTKTGFGLLYKQVQTFAKQLQEQGEFDPSKVSE